MKAVRVIQSFREKGNYAKLYEVGTTLQVENNRANELEALGLVEPLKKAKNKADKE